jgi:hypothetical protein
MNQFKLFQNGHTGRPVSVVNIGSETGETGGKFRKPN